jgi:hypothetical protein
MHPTGRNSDPNFWFQVTAAYGFPTVMFALAIIPGLNFSIYTGHGGIGWLVLPLCFPFVTVLTLVKTMKGSDRSRAWYRHFFKVTIPAYIALALPLSWVATSSIRNAFGLDVPAWTFFAVMVSPFPWTYFT